MTKKEDKTKVNDGGMANNEAGESKERKVKEVDSWDGSASNYKDAESYCNCCLINLNDAAGNTDTADWTKGLCKLPIREEGDSKDTFVKQALYAAAGGRGITAVTKPADVSQDDFDAAVKKAANEMAKYYDELGEEVPESVSKLRAKSMMNIYDEIYQKIQPLFGLEDYPYLNEIYADDNGALFAIVSAQMGKLWKVPFVIGTDGVTLGEPQEVEIDFKSVQAQRSNMIIKRDATGALRWFFFPACAAVMNRCGEIDSTKLFDSFVKYVDAGGEYPELDFFHMGSEYKELRFGRADFIARDGYLYLASGVFYDDDVSQRVAEVLASDTENYWGCSIEYRFSDMPDMLEVQPGIEIPVFNKGINTFISILPESMAASWMTTGYVNRGQEVNKMNETLAKILKRLVGDDKVADNLIKDIDGKNRTIADDPKIIKRDGSGDETVTVVIEEQPAAPVAEKKDEPVTDPKPEPETEASNDDSKVDNKVVEVGDDVLVAIVDKVSEKVTATVTEKLNEVTALLTGMQTMLETSRAASKASEDKIKELSDKVTELSKDDADKKERWVKDLPARTVLTITHRAKTIPDDEDDEEKAPTFADKAESVLETMSTKK